MAISGLLVFLAVVVMATGTPLEDYVRAADPNYSYRVLNEERGDGYTMYNLNMTSQSWGEGYVINHTLWWHFLTIVVPDNITYTDVGCLMVDGGDNKNGPYDNPFVLLVASIAVSTGMVCGDLWQIPNQPLHFYNDPSGRSWHETAVLAWTISTYLREGQDPLKLIHLPMTKAGVRGMDTVVDFAQKKRGLNIKKFFITGASKRGWTAWLTAAVDDRVIALLPIVYDLLNMSASMHHMFRAYGGWSFALKDFYELNFTQFLDSPEEKAVEAIIDPLAYTEKLRMPKMIMNSCGDEYFMLDNSHYYLSQLQGPTYLKKTPNADHVCVGHVLDLMFAMRAFILQIAENKPLPKFSWTTKTNGNSSTLVLTCETTPYDVTAYYAETLDGGLANRRDFRLLIANPADPDHKTQPHPVPWFKTSPFQTGPKEYTMQMDARPGTWRAFFIQVSYLGVRGSVMEFTTDVIIVPDTFPFPPCHGDACRGALV